MVQLAESYPIRRAAQLGAYVFLRGKQLRMYSLNKMSFFGDVNIIIIQVNVTMYVLICTYL